MSLHAEAERLQTLQRDIDRWNTLTAEERARWLHQEKWGPYNKLASMLTKEQSKVLQSHSEFKPLREAFTACQLAGSPVDQVMKVTEMLVRAVERL